MKTPGITDSLPLSSIHNFIAFTSFSELLWGGFVLVCVGLVFLGFFFHFRSAQGCEQGLHSLFLEVDYTFDCTDACAASFSLWLLTDL